MSRPGRRGAAGAGTASCPANAPRSAVPRLSCLPPGRPWATLAKRRALHGSCHNKDVTARCLDCVPAAVAALWTNVVVPTWKARPGPMMPTPWCARASAPIARQIRLSGGDHPSRLSQDLTAQMLEEQTRDVHCCVWTWAPVKRTSPKARTASSSIRPNFMPTTNWKVPCARSASAAFSSARTASCTMWTAWPVAPRLTVVPSQGGP